MKEYSTTVHGLAFGGDGVGRVDGKVCFVRGALPAEEVVFKVLKETKSYIKGEVTEIKIKSSDRVDPVCKYYGVCGGCQYQHLDYKKEVEYKRAQVENLMQRFGGLTDVSLDIVCSNLDYNYRDSITLHKGEQEYGFYSVDKNKIIPIDNCAIAAKSLNGFLLQLKDRDVSRLTIKKDNNGKTWVSDQSDDLFYSDNYCGQEIILSSRGFSQCNRFIISSIVEQLNEWIKKIPNDAVLFDLYCGVGFFSFLLKGFKNCVGIDYEGISIDCAQKTAGFKKDNKY